MTRVRTHTHSAPSFNHACSQDQSRLGLAYQLTQLQGTRGIRVGREPPPLPHKGCTSYNYPIMNSIEFDRNTISPICVHGMQATGGCIASDFRRDAKGLPVTEEKQATKEGQWWLGSW